jgi:EmrB/QacA subfamily drug resistance transporter
MHTLQTSLKGALVSIAYSTRQACDEARIEAGSRLIPCPQRDKPWVLATAILGSSLAFIEGSVVNLALPAIQADLGARSTELQWVVNAYLLMLGSFMLIGGSLGDRYGLRRVFMLGTAIFGIGALACAAAPTLSLLVVARAVQGLGGALLVPTSLALISSHFDDTERGRAIGTWAGASALTTAIGPVLGGWLVDQWGWPAVFLLITPLASLTVFIAWRRVPVSPVSGEKRLDYWGSLLLATSLGILIYTLVTPAALWLRVLLFIGALVLGAVFIWREWRCEAPMLPLDLFRSRAFSGANLMTLLLYCALNGALYFLPFNLIQVQGYSAVQAGAAFLPFSLILGFGSTFAGGLIRKFNPRLILTIGPLVAALGFAALALPGNAASFIAGFLPGIVLIGVGMTLSVAPLTTVVMGSVGGEEAGVASGVNNTAARLAGVLAVAVLTAVAVGQFAGALDKHLQQAGVPPELVEKLDRQASQLAELKAPADVTGAIVATIEAAIAHAYIGAFRVLMIICGALAALSGAVAWFSLGKGGGVAGRKRRGVLGGRPVPIPGSGTR